MFALVFVGALAELLFAGQSLTQRMCNSTRVLASVALCALVCVNWSECMLCSVLMAGRVGVSRSVLLVLLRRSGWVLVFAEAVAHLRVTR